MKKKLLTGGIPFPYMADVIFVFISLEGGVGISLSMCTHRFWVIWVGIVSVFWVKNCFFHIFLSGRGGAVLKIFRAGLGQPFFLGLGQGGACIPDFSNHKGVTVLNCITKKVAYCILRQYTILQNIALPFSARLDVTNCAHWENNFSFLAQTFRNSLQEQVQEEGAGAGGAIIQEI